MLSPRYFLPRQDAARARSPTDRSIVSEETKPSVPKPANGRACNSLSARGSLEVSPRCRNPSGYPAFRRTRNKPKHERRPRLENCTSNASNISRSPTLTFFEAPSNRGRITARKVQPRRERGTADRRNYEILDDRGKPIARTRKQKDACDYLRILRLLSPARDALKRVSLFPRLSQTSTINI